MRFLSIFCERKVRIDHRRHAYPDSSSSQRTNNPYAQFDDRNYEMGDVRSTTNLTAGFSGGTQESMSEFYDEVTSALSLFMSSARYQGLPTPADSTRKIRSLILDFPTRSRSHPSKTA